MCYVVDMSVKEIEKGKWLYEFMQKGERKHGLCYGCTTKTQAIEFENDMRYILSLQQRGKIPREVKITFKQMMDNYLTYSKANKLSYRKDLTHKKVLTEFFGANKDIQDIKAKDVEEFKLFIKDKKKLSNATFNRYYSALKKAYNLIIDDNPAILNPCRTVKKLKEDNRKTRYLTKEEETALLDELADHLKPIVIVALQTGLRKSNILNLRWENIDFEQMFIEVLKQENKGHKKIQILISEKLHKTLLELEPKEKGYIFVNPETNKPYTDIKTGFNKAVERAKIANFTFHDLRHTVGTRLMADGSDIRSVQEFLGHSQVSTTERYLHVTTESRKKAVSILNSY